MFSDIIMISGEKASDNFSYIYIYTAVFPKPLSALQKENFVVNPVSNSARSLCASSTELTYPKLYIYIHTYIHTYIYIYIYIDIALWHYKALLSLLCILTSLSSSSPLAWLG